jgi:hypothetical protein
MFKQSSSYLTFIDIAFEVSKVLPDYSSKFSKQTFTQRQLMTLYILKQKSKLSYEEFLEDFSTRDCAIEDLNLKKIPSDSTIKMFISRIQPSLLGEIIIKTIELTNNKNIETAIDSTGFQLEDGSYSYMKRIGTAMKKRKNLKLSSCVDTKKHLFLSVKIRKSNAHDSKDFKPLILKAKETGKIIICNTGDKAYDSEELHEFSEEQGFVNIVPLRNKTNKVWRVQGRLRKKLARNFPSKKYHRRSIIENMWFCVKRLCGKVVFAKKWINQKKEVIGKVIAYNIYRLVQLRRI